MTNTMLVKVKQLMFHSCCQGCGVGVVGFWARVGFLTALGAGVGFFCPTPIPEVQLDHFLHHTPKLGIPVEMVQFFLKLLLKQRFLAVYHDLD